MNCRASEFRKQGESFDVLRADRPKVAMIHRQDYSSVEALREGHNRSVDRTKREICVLLDQVGYSSPVVDLRCFDVHDGERPNEARFDLRREVPIYQV